MIDPLLIINQLFELQAKLKEHGTITGFERNLNRLFNMFEEEGYILQDPTDEVYHETRTDCEVSISGHLGAKMRIVRTIKPIIYLRKEGKPLLIQKAVVIVEKN